MGTFIEVSKTYTYKGKVYVVTKYEPGKYLTKDADSGNWHDAVEYTTAPAEMTFVRAASDFEEKFAAA